MTKRSIKPRKPGRGRVSWERLLRMTDEEVERTSPPELANLPDDFWDNAPLVAPANKEAISLRVDPDVLEWFRKSGPRYQTRMNAILRSYVDAMRPRRTKTRKKVAR